MKKSGYRTTFHIYLIFFLTLLITVLSAAVLFSLLITVQKPDGSTARSDWPKRFTENFREQLLFTDGSPQISQEGIDSLAENRIGLQILNPGGREIFSFQKPDSALSFYSAAELLRLEEGGRTAQTAISAFTGTVYNGGEDFVYILYFPINVSKITMFLNGKRFWGGRPLIVTLLCVLSFVVFLFGAAYGLRTAKLMERLSVSIRDISLRSYRPIRRSGTFQDLYDSLNELDETIKMSDHLRQQTEKIREEWITNITHDLKTPLSPIKGYAELMLDGGQKEQSCGRYAAIILKNAGYMEALIDDLKLTYQLDGGLLPVCRENLNFVRFMRELAIDILNTPEYESRDVFFESTEEDVFYCFDPKLMTRAFRNLILNAFVHGEESTKVTLRISSGGGALQILVEDNGPGMKPEETEHLFDRYYRGINAGERPDGTGLGLAIAKSIVELHSGTLSVSSVPGCGTVFHIKFPFS